MKQFKNLRESLNDIVLDLYETSEDFDAEELNEAVKKDNPKVEGQVTNNTRGVLHELLTGKALNNDKHMPDFHLVDEKTNKKQTPEEAHDKLKSQIHPNDYAKIKAGADVVQIYTGLIYKGPALVTEAAAAIKSLIA